ncbi:hypothetical protein GCM10009591_10500 [Brachybacterium tyrofermentans]
MVPPPPSDGMIVTVPLLFSPKHSPVMETVSPRSTLCGEAPALGAWHTTGGAAGAAPATGAANVADGIRAHEATSTRPAPRPVAAER